MSTDFVDAFCHEIIEKNGLLLLGTAQARVPHDGIDPDPVGVETTLNKRHVTSLVGNSIPPDARDELMRCGRALVQVWAERIALRFPGREVAFYVGGSDSVIIRFHVRREGHVDWTDLGDDAFLERAAIEVYILRDGELLHRNDALRRT